MLKFGLVLSPQFNDISLMKSPFLQNSVSLFYPLSPPLHNRIMLNMWKVRVEETKWGESTINNHVKYKFAVNFNKYSVFSTLWS